MKFVIAILCFVSVARAAEFFVALNGNDVNPGNLEQPFASIRKAQDAAGPGDTIHIRGGTYTMQESQATIRNGFAYIHVLDKSGTRENPITYEAYQDEIAVFDCSKVKPEGVRIDAFFVSGSWLRLRGLTVSGVQVTIKEHTQSICFENAGSHNILERLRMHDGQAIGIYSVKGSDNVYLNCDAWNNWDYTSENGKGGNVDGFGCHPSKGSTGNIFRGCRAWFNSDDGFDCINSHESVTFENCWAYYNGLSTKFQSLGDGNGFKSGGYGSTPIAKLPAVIPRHVVRFCVAVGNKANGFYSNHHIGGSDWINNTAYKNGVNFNMLCRMNDNATEVDGYGHKLWNNLSFKSKTDIAKFDAQKCDAQNNSFTLGTKFGEKDFESVDESELLQPRQANGDLPAIKFLHPSNGSAAIDTGIDAGFPFKGAAPELGAFETK